MKWLDDYFQGWQRCMDYQGRATRSAFWWFLSINLLITVLLGYAVLVFAETFGIRQADAWAATLQTLFVVPCGMALLALGIRRMHDINRSGWWFSLVFFLPLLEQLVDPALKVMLSVDGFALMEPFCQALLVLLPLLGVGALCCQRSHKTVTLAPWDPLLQDL